MDWLLSLLRIMLEKASPDIRQALVELIKKWEVDALASSNKVDDVLVYIVKKLLLIED